MIQRVSEVETNCEAVYSKPDLYITESVDAVECKTTKHVERVVW